MLRKILLLSISLTVLLVNAQKEGDIYSIEKKMDLTPSGVIDFVNAENNRIIPSEILKHIKSFKVGVKAYKLKYYTKDYQGKLVIATGLVMLPESDKKLSTILYCRGTTLNRKSVASNLHIVTSVIPLIYTLNGYIVVAPDYYGMGDGEGTQNYAHTKTTADSVLNMFKAANTFLDQLKMERYEEYFLSGYSLGGHAGMAALKKATEENLYKFKHVYLGAGPHDLSYSTFQRSVLEKDFFPVSALLAKVVYSCNKTGYKLKEDNESWNKVISDEYLPKFKESLVNDKGGLLWGPLDWKKLFSKNFIRQIRNNQNHTLRKCLRASDVYDWNNTTPTTLTDGAFDGIINPENNEVTVKAQRAYYPLLSLEKYKIKRVQFGPFTHITGMFPWIIGATFKFNTLRKGGFFNLKAEKIRNRGMYEESQNSMNLERSAIKPTLTINNEEHSVVLNKIGEDKKIGRRAKDELNKAKQGVYLAETIINGKTINFPMVVEKPIVVKTNQIINQISEKEFEINVKDLSEEVKTIRFFNADKKIVKEINPLKTVRFTSDNLMGNEVIEVVTENNIFTTTFNNNVVDTDDLRVLKSAENIVVTMLSSKINNIEIYNVLGQKIISENHINESTYQLKYQEGINLIKIQDIEGRTYTKKVLFE